MEEASLLPHAQLLLVAFEAPALTPPLAASAHVGGAGAVILVRTRRRDGCG
jgi:hypothetical protein